MLTHAFGGAPALSQYWDNVSYFPGIILCKRVRSMRNRRCTCRLEVQCTSQVAIPVHTETDIHVMLDKPIEP